MSKSVAKWGKWEIIPSHGPRQQGPTNALFTGSTDITIDSKQRLAIPAKVRSQLDPEKDKAWFCVPWPGGILRLYSESEFTSLAASWNRTLIPASDQAELEAELFGRADRDGLGGSDHDPEGFARFGRAGFGSGGGRRPEPAGVPGLRGWAGGPDGPVLEARRWWRSSSLAPGRWARFAEEFLTTA